MTSQVGVYCYIKNGRPWMYCHTFYISGGSMGKVYQACELIDTLGSGSSKHQSPQAVGPYLVRTAKEPCHPQVGVCYYTKNHRPWMCCQTFHIFYWRRGRYNKPETQSIHMTAVHPSHRAPKLWDQIWWELQDNHVILRLVYVVTWRTTHHGCVATHSTYCVNAWARSDKPGI